MSIGLVLALKIVACVILCYFLGSFNASYLLGKAFKQKDVREYGSHNPGSTNAIRTFGAKFGFICMAVDILKGVIAMLLIRLIMWHTLDPFETPPHHDLLVLIQLGCGLVCMLGHMYPFYMHFKGGKGIAVSLGVLIAINWKVFLIAGIPSLIILAIFRIMSVASLSFETLIFIMYIVFYGGHHPYGWFILLAAFFYPFLAYYGHRGNLKRLVHGEEPRLWGPGSPKYEAQKEAAAYAVDEAGGIESATGPDNNDMSATAADTASAGNSKVSPVEHNFTEDNPAHRSQVGTSASRMNQNANDSGTRSRHRTSASGSTPRVVNRAASQNPKQEHHRPDANSKHSRRSETGQTSRVNKKSSAKPHARRKNVSNARRRKPR